jgi:hypothetical protein
MTGDRDGVGQHLEAAAGTLRAWTHMPSLQPTSLAYVGPPTHLQITQRGSVGWTPRTIISSGTVETGSVKQIAADNACWRGL